VGGWEVAVHSTRLAVVSGLAGGGSSLWYLHLCINQEGYITPLYLSMDKHIYIQPSTCRSTLMFFMSIRCVHCWLGPHTQRTWSYPCMCVLT
jgi:hypothetical protein